MSVRLVVTQQLWFFLVFLGFSTLGYLFISLLHISLFFTLLYTLTYDIFEYYIHRFSQSHTTLFLLNPYSKSLHVSAEPRSVLCVCLLALVEYVLQLFYVPIQLLKISLFFLGYYSIHTSFEGQILKRTIQLRWVLFIQVMDVFCVLEVDVNGEEVFMVDKVNVSCFILCFILTLFYFLSSHFSTNYISYINIV